jgi:hypothetical protein
MYKDLVDRFPSWSFLAADHHRRMNLDFKVVDRSILAADHRRRMNIVFKVVDRKQCTQEVSWLTTAIALLHKGLPARAVYGLRSYLPYAIH